MMNFRDRAAGCPLVAILRWIGPDEVEAIGDVLLAAGFQLIEVPLNSPRPFESIERLARRFGDAAIIGAGTVMTPGAVRDIYDAGGTMVVMPHADTAVIHAAKEAGCACLPGVATPTEGFAALDAGADALKLFPAEMLPPRVLRAWRAVFTDDVALLPTGGIAPETMADYVAGGASGFGIGGGLYAPGRSVVDVRERAESYIAAWRHIVAESGGSA